MKNWLGKIALWTPGFRHQLMTFEMLREVSGVLQDIRKELVMLRSAEAGRHAENIRMSSDRMRDPKRLLAYGAQINSQNGEDGMIAEIFRRIGFGSNSFVEIGVEDGRESNTAFLLSCGWCGFWIDGGSSMNLTLDGRGDIDRNCLKTLSAIVTAENASSLLQNLEVSVEFDLLSIDIDQNTYYIWEALDAYRPRVVVIEYNAVIPAEIDWKVNYSANRIWDGSQNYGASLKALELLGCRHGYNLVGCDFTGSNAFFVREDLVGNHFLSPYTAENHYEPIRQPFTFYRNHRREILDRSTPGPRN